MSKKRFTLLLSCPLKRKECFRTRPQGMGRIILFQRSRGYATSSSTSVLYSASTSTSVQAQASASRHTRSQDSRARSQPEACICRSTRRGAETQGRTCVAGRSVQRRLIAAASSLLCESALEIPFVGFCGTGPEYWSRRLPGGGSAGYAFHFGRLVLVFSAANLR